MASDRIFIRSKISGKKQCIAKHLGAGWYAKAGIAKTLDEFFDDHQDEFWQDSQSFELVYERSKAITEDD